MTIQGDCGDSDRAVFVVASVDDIVAAKSFLSDGYAIISYSGKWDETDWEPLRGRAKVRLWPIDTQDDITAAGRLAQYLIGPLECADVRILLDAEGIGPLECADMHWNYDSWAEWAAPRLQQVHPEHPILPNSAAQDSTPAFSPVLSLTEPVPDAAEPNIGEPPDWAQEGPEYPPYDAVPHNGADPIAERSSVFSVETDPWGTPQDFWGESTLPDFDQRTLPPEISDFAFDVAHRLGSDPVITAASAYATATAAIRNDIFVQMLRDSHDWKERAVTWTAVLGGPTSKKTPGMDRAVSALIHVDTERRHQNESDFARYEQEQQIYEAKRQAYVRDMAKGGVGEAPAAPDSPLSTRMLLDDFTKEAAAKLLAHSERQKLLIYKDELVAFLSSFDRYTANSKGPSADRADYLAAYESKGRYIDRASQKAVFVPSWALSILGGIQPDRLARLTDLSDDGFLTRFQIVAVRDCGEGDESRAPNKKAKADWERLVANMVALQPPPSPILLSAEAADYRRTQAKELFRLMRAMPDSRLQNVIGKWEGLMGRLMLTSHCIRAASRNQREPGAEIGLDIAQQCWRWMIDLLLPHAMHIYSTLLSADQYGKPKIQAVADFILARSVSVLRTDELNQNWTGYRKLQPGEKKELFSYLLTAGWLRPIAGYWNPISKMPTRYTVNPAVHATFADQAEIARQSRQVKAEMFDEIRARKKSRHPGEDDAESAAVH